MSTLSCGSQTQLANSTVGLTIDMCAVSLVLVDAIFKFRLKNPRVLFALVVTIYIYIYHVLPKSRKARMEFFGQATYQLLRES